MDDGQVVLAERGLLAVSDDVWNLAVRRAAVIGGWTITWSAPRSAPGGAAPNIAYSTDEAFTVRRASACRSCSPSRSDRDGGHGGGRPACSSGALRNVSRNPWRIISAALVILHFDHRPHHIKAFSNQLVARNRSLFTLCECPASCAASGDREPPDHRAVGGAHRG